MGKPEQPSHEGQSSQSPPGIAGDLAFTGERVIPGRVEADLFNEHMARYAYARQFCLGKRVLDTGSGVGYGSHHLATAAAAVVGIDNDPQTVEYARAHFSGANTAYLVADCHRLPFEAATFDVVTSFELIEHLADAKLYLAEVRRVLKPDGIFVVSTPNRTIYAEHRGGEANPFHIREWDCDEFSNLLKDYFGYVEFLGESHLPAVGILAESVGKEIPVDLQARPELNKSDYFVCVCSHHPINAGYGLLFLPSSANVLLERERHIRALTTELADRNAYLARLQPEFEEKARWANNLNAEVSRLQSLYAAAVADCGAAVADKATFQAENRRLSAEVEILGALWRKATRWKRMVASLALVPLDLMVAFVLICCGLIGRILRLISPLKAPAFPPTKPECSFIIVSWNGKDLLAESLPPLIEEVRRQGGNHEIIVVDNGSIDGTSDFVKQTFPEVVVVRSEQNLYFGGGNRLGTQAATRDILVLLNNDMIVEAGFLDPLLRAFSDPSVFGVASQVFMPAGKPRQETGKTRADFNGSDLDWRHDAISTSDEANQYPPVFWLHGGASAIDRRKYMWLGGLDVLYDPFYVEDADLSYRAWKVGWRCLLAPQSHVLHKHRSSTQRFGEGFIRQIVRRNHYIFLWKNFGDIRILLGHFLHASRVRTRRAGVPGVGIQREIRAYLGALQRLAPILSRRMRSARSAERTDQEIFAIVNEPRPSRITSSEIDFSRGDFDGYLGGRWYGVERDGGRPYRWMSDKASVFLSVPSENAELVVEGYVPPLSNYGGAPLVLTLCGAGQQQQLALDEGTFSHTWRIEALTRGEPVRVEFTLNRTIQNSGDERTLGLMVHRVALLATNTGGAATQNSGSPRHMRRPESLRIRGGLAGNSLGEPVTFGPTVGIMPGQARVLVVCAYLPCLGVHSGGNTMFHLISNLARRHRLTVLSFYESESELEHIPALAQYCERLEVLYRGQTFETANVWGLKPAEIVYEFYHSRMRRLVQQYLATQKYDLIQCEFLQMAHFAKAHPTIPAVLTNHELLSLAYRNRYHHLSWRSPEKLSALVHWMRILNYEEEMLRRFSAVVVLTRPEREFLARYAPGVPVYDHPTGVDTDFFRPTGREPRPYSLIFVGNFRHGPNVDGVLWLLERVWPSILAQNPNASLTIVGDNPPASVRDRHGRDNIVVTGWVPDIRPFLEEAAVFAAPLFEGVGLRGKVLEAWSMARPVVGTRLAFEALKNREGETGFFADEPESFAQSIQRLWSNPELAGTMGSNARRLVESSFSWDAFAGLYDRIYQKILNRSLISEPARTTLQEVAKQA